MNLSDNAKKIFETLYCFPGETISDTFKRVANEYGSTEEEIEFIYNLLAKGIWRPNSPVFFNAATSHKMFSACHIVGLDDSMDSIYDVLNVSRMYWVEPTCYKNYLWHFTILVRASE